MTDGGASDDYVHSQHGKKISSTRKSFSTDEGDPQEYCDPSIDHLVELIMASEFKQDSPMSEADLGKLTDWDQATSALYRLF